MAKVWNSMITKLTIAFIALVLVISGMTFIYTYNETKTALLSQMQNELVDMSQVFSSRVNGDAIGSLQPGDEITSNFTTARDMIREMRMNSTFLTYSYILRVDGETIQFLIDDTYGYDVDAPVIGDVYETSDADKIIAALSEPTTSSKIYADVWGSFLSGYAPIFDSEGNAVAVMAVDMDATTVLKNQDFIGNTIYLIMAASIIFAGIIVALFALTMSRDIKKLNKAAEKISKGDMSAEVDVKRKDEIGDLADSFSRMLASLKFEMMMRQEDEAEKKEKN